ncbi:MAG: DNA repair protein RecO [Desulfobacterales bacterium]|nr:DNA repair protein RecO [Desulfobacterales bacterium]
MLRKIEFGDHDYIITFMTQSHGKIAAIAKNAKKSVQRFSGALDLFSLNHIQCSRSKRKQDSLMLLNQSELEQGFANIRYDVHRTAYASYWVEMTYLWVEEGEPQLELYNLLKFSLEMLHGSDIKKEVLSILFQIRFMGISGFSPNLDCCDACRNPLDGIPSKKVWFDFREGKILCPGCSQKGSGYGTRVSKGTLKQIFWLNGTPMDKADRIRLPEFALKEAENLLESFIPFHIGREFRSLKFLRRLRQEQWT